jgi:hypothetical protein
MTTFAEHYVPRGPRVTINGVQYEITYGDGWALERDWNGVLVTYPVYVWRSVDEPDYTAPKHVSDACNERYALAYDFEQAERAAGRDPNP